MGEAELKESVRTVYQKDLYRDTYSLYTRIDTDKLEDGDRLKFTVSKVDNIRTESESNSETQKDLRGRVSYKISKAVHGILTWLLE